MVRRKAQSPPWGKAVLLTSSPFAALDWAILAAYVLLLALAGWWSSRQAPDSAAAYFLAGHHAPAWLVAISALSTMQSAATFIGVPDNSFRGDFSYLATNIGALLAAVIVAHLLVPRYFAAGVTTVYELLEQRFDRRAQRAAAFAYLAGRILASGARLYLAALAVSLMLFLDMQPMQVALAALLLVAFGLAFTLFGGLNAVIWSDLVQVILYTGGALLVAILLWFSLPMTSSTMVAALAEAEGGSKLTLFDWSLDPARPYAMPAIIIGMTLLNIGNFGLDQDSSQRFIACESPRAARRALYGSALATIPVVLLFLIVGALLFLHYQQSGSMPPQTGPDGRPLAVFMGYILTELPPGMRGLLTVGVIAAAAINSGLISMAAVAVSDFYRPWAERRGGRGAAHYVAAGRWAVLLLALALLATAVFCYYWQRYSAVPLLDFVLGVMVFAYSGLLGVYAAALFTKRGSSASVITALVAGFGTIALQQPWVVDQLGLPPLMKALAFPWQLTIGSVIAFLVACSGKGAGHRFSPSPGAPQPL
jgi:Na+/proline symporter